MRESREALQAAVKAAKNHDIPLIVASTTGRTAEEALTLARAENVRLFVVTHDEGRRASQARFSAAARQQLVAAGATVYTHQPPFILFRKILDRVLGCLGLSPWMKHLAEIGAKYGEGIKVGHIIVQMLREGGVLKDGVCVAAAGASSGADSVGLFVVRSESRWPILKEIIARPK